MIKRTWISTLLLLTLTWVATTTSCTKVDNTIGEGLIPNGQMMKIGIDTLTGINAYLAQVDSMPTNYSAYSYIGKMSDPDYGYFEARMIALYTPMAFSVEDGSFGDGAVADSIHLYINSVTNLEFYGDTSKTQTFNVYELSRRFHFDDDTLYYSPFDYTQAIYPELLGTFTVTGVASDYYKLDGPQADVLMQRLLDESDDIYYGGEEYDSLFIERNRGICIVPAESSDRDAFIQTLDYSYSELLLYTHRPKTDDEISDEEDLAEEEDWGDDYEVEPDTIIIARYGLTSESTSLPNFPSFKGDYSSVTAFDVNTINDTLPTSTPVSIGYVQGQGGVSTYLRFTEEFVEKLFDLAQDPYTSVVVTSAKVDIPVVDPTIDILDNSFARLGSYEDYSQLEPILDYGFWDEIDASYSITIPYDGYLNRTSSSYPLNITRFIQSIITTGEIRDYTMMLGPGFLLDLYAPQTVALEVGVTESNPEGLEVALVYVLVQ